MQDFISDAYIHAKLIAFTQPAETLLEKTIGREKLDDGVIEIDRPAKITQFVAGCRRLRFWEREHELGSN